MIFSILKVQGLEDAVQFECPGLPGGIGQLRQKDSETPTRADRRPGERFRISQQSHLRREEMCDLVYYIIWETI